MVLFKIFPGVNFMVNKLKANKVRKKKKSINAHKALKKIKIYIE